MSAQRKQINEWEQKYNDLTELYALSDDLLATIEASANPGAQFEVVAPLVEVIGESTDLLTEEYINLCEGKKDHKSKSRIEGALRKVYMALHDFGVRVSDSKNAATAIVKKIKRQLEQVISNFMEFLTLSLDRMMQKQDVEELKARHAHIALMLHQSQLSQQGA